jgi:hypothetical protein
MLALVISADLAARIAARNTAVRALIPVVDDQGRQVLPADLLTDCGAGQTWDDYGDLLADLVPVEVTLPPPPATI